MPGVAAPDTSLVCNGNCPEGSNEQQRIFGNPPQVPEPGRRRHEHVLQVRRPELEHADAERRHQAARRQLQDGAVAQRRGSATTATRRTGAIPSRTTACADYFPIIYINGDLKVQANSRGQGVLLVNGNMEMAGGFEFNGIVIVRDDIKSTGNGNKISGSAFAGNTYTTDNTSVTGNSEIQYSRCAIERAGEGLGDDRAHEAARASRRSSSRSGIGNREPGT